MDERSGAVVRSAAKAIEKYGWIQNADGSPEYGGMCIRGAINYIEMEQWLEDRSRQVWRSSEAEFSQWMDSIGQYKEIREADERLAGIADGSECFVPYWNDRPERTKAEVLLYMNKFADEVDPQGP